MRGWEPGNPSVDALEPSITLRVADMAREMERAGTRVIKLQTGDPDFATPAPVVEAAEKAMREGLTHYSDTRGLFELREAVAARVRAESGLTYDPAAEVQVTVGGVHGLCAALLALVRPGDEVAVLDPSWMPYAALARIAGGIPVRVPSAREDDFRFEAGELRERIGPRTRFLIVNSPANPSGRVLTEAQLKDIAAVAEERDLCVVADEVYEKLVYGDAVHRRFAALPGMRARTVTVNSFSKTFAMTGWRVGYVTAPKLLMDRIVKVSQYSVTNVAPFVQRAALAALTDPAVPPMVERMRRAYDGRRQRIAHRLKGESAVRAIDPQGAFYCLVDVSRVRASSVGFAEDLLRRERVCVVPGVGFGECAEGTVRLTFAAADGDIDEGLERLLRLAAAG